MFNAYGMIPTLKVDLNKSIQAFKSLIFYKLGRVYMVFQRRFNRQDATY